MSEELERAIISLALLDPKAAEIVINLEEDFFADTVMRKAFTILKSMKTENPDTPCDVFTVAALIPDERERRILFDTVALGYQHLDGQAKEQLALQYVRQLAKTKVARDLVAALSQTITQLRNNPQELEAHLAHLEGLVGEAIVKLPNIVDSELPDTDMKALHEAFRRDQLILFGIPVIDDAIRSAAPGDLFVIAGRTSVGKTALAIQASVHSALNGRKVLYVTLEMRRSEILVRFYSHIGFVKMDWIFNPKAKSSQVRQLALAMNIFKQLPIKIVDPSAYSEAFDTPQLAIAMQSYSPDIVVVDYLHLMASAKDEGMVEALTELSRELKRLALRYNCVIVGISQINRTAQASEADIEQIYYSSSLAHAASQILMIRPKKDPSPIPDVRDVELALVKNRNGPTWSTKAVFIPKVMRFVADPVALAK